MMQNSFKCPSQQETLYTSVILFPVFVFFIKEMTEYVKLKHRLSDAVLITGNDDPAA
jgi:hypothetical protein